MSKSPWIVSKIFNLTTIFKSDDVVSSGPTTDFVLFFTQRRGAENINPEYVEGYSERGDP
jgi:hypothetical protein